MIKTKRKIAKQIFSFILVLSMMMCGLPSTFFAETGSKPPLNITEADIKISEETAGMLKVQMGLTNLYYSANEQIVITGTTARNGIVVNSGNPTVVLRDCEIITGGSPFTIQSKASVNLKLEGKNILGAGRGGAGIHVPSGASVTIDGSGILEVDGGANAAGIGGNDWESGGTITINGGTVKARSYYGAAIGGGHQGKSGGTITITGGVVKANGSYGAGIGGGSDGNSGTILITGGTVEARTDEEGAGIGGGYCGNGENIKITGGKITAYGGDYGAGIGGGRYGSGGEISITGGTVEAGGYYGAGIGGGSEGSGGTITITGGTVEAGGYYGAGIGGGSAGSGGKITIHGGTVRAVGDPYGAGIGGGERGAGGNVTITGGNVNPNPIYGLGNLIGAGNQALDHGTLTDGNGNRVNAYVLTLDGVTEPVSVTTISGITYGLKDVSTLDNNKLYFYLPDGASVDTITAGGKDYTCKDSSNNTYYTAHDWSKKDGVCVRCGSECNHATITGEVCDTCGKSISACDHVQGEILYTGTGEYAPDCVNGGLGHRECTKCHAVMESSIVVAALGHRYISRVTTAATTTSEGIMTYICDRCGHNYTKPIPKLTDNEPQGNQKQPDNSNVGNKNQPNSNSNTQNNNSANTNKPASNNQTGNTVKPSNNISQVSSDKPYIEGKSEQNGWENIKEQLKETTTGVTVAMNGTSIVPGTVLDTIKGKDVSVVFDLGDGITWTVNGKDITAEQVGDIDFGVTVGEQAGNTIPVDIINKVTGERYSMNVSLAYDGEFGFSAILTINADKENAGLFANLFYYNPESGELEYICASQIDEDGNANLEFTHASDYVVVVDEEDLQATETNRGEDISATPDEVVSADTEETTAGNSWWFIVIGAIVVIAGVGIFFATKKKETEK